VVRVDWLSSVRVFSCGSIHYVSLKYSTEVEQKKEEIIAPK
jgi:hypothetical protein